MRAYSTKKLSIVLILLSGLGCSHTLATYPTSGFLEDYYRLRPGSVFQQEYIAPEADFSKYSRVQIRPLVTRFLTDKHLFKEEELKEMDRVFRRKFMELNAGKYQFIAPEGRANSQTLIIETALTLLKPSRRLLNFVAPVTRGETALEVRISSGDSKHILLEAAEKSFGSPRKKSFIIGAYTKLSDSTESFDYWVQKLSWLIEAY